MVGGESLVYGVKSGNQTWSIGEASNNVFNGSQLGIGTFDSKPIQLATNNAVAMTIDGSGNVGINTATPAAPLDVNGNLNLTMFIGCGNGCDSPIAKAKPYSSFLVTWSSNYGVGNLVRSGIYHIQLNAEGTAVAFSNPVSELNINGGGYSRPTFDVGGGYLLIKGLDKHNHKVAVVGD